MFISFVGLLISLYLNYLTEYFNKFKLTIREEKDVLEQVIFYASELMFEFFDTNNNFFFEFLNVFEEFNLSCCYGLSQHKPKSGPYKLLPMTLEFHIL